MDTKKLDFLLSKISAGTNDLSALSGHLQTLGSELRTHPTCQEDRKTAYRAEVLAAKLETLMEEIQGLFPAASDFNCPTL